MKINRKPEWLRINLANTENMKYVDDVLAAEKLNTVCREAKCPNIHECWGKKKTATFMVLGDICTRNCRFCAVKTGKPPEPDYTEIPKIVSVSAKLGIKHIVITMVNRDDLEDGGAGFIAMLTDRIRTKLPGITIEILSSDMNGSEKSVDIMMSKPPDIMSHNIETVKRLTPLVRSGAEYERSLRFLRKASGYKNSVIKSSIMLGLGETRQEIAETMDDLLDNGVTVLNMGQYLQPGKDKIEVVKYWNPEEFAGLKKLAERKGFAYCCSGPLVRSSYMADENPLLLKQ